MTGGVDPDWIDRVNSDDWLSPVPRLIVTRDRKGQTALVVGRRAAQVIEEVLGPRRAHGGAFSVPARHVPAIVAVAERLGGSVSVEDVR